MTRRLHMPEITPSFLSISHLLKLFFTLSALVPPAVWYFYKVTHLITKNVNNVLLTFSIFLGTPNKL